jgi:uncharacterized membrane protein YhaH (DUF805 family)
MVAAHTLVWSEGMTDWLPASSIDGLFEAPIPQAAPAPTLHQPQINLGSPMATQSAPAQVNPYSKPQANLGMGSGIQPKLTLTGILFSFMGLIILLYIPMIWCMLAIQCKRWHDLDKSGWWYFISWIPFVGSIWFLIETGCLRGTFGLNRYGEDPT